MANHENDLSDRLAVADEALRDFCSEIERLTGEAIDCIRWEVLRHPDLSYFYYRLCGSGREYWDYSLAEALTSAHIRWPAPAVDPDPEVDLRRKGDLVNIDLAPRF